jgi:hypothetical protein
MEATSQGTPVAATAPPSPDVPGPLPELLEPLELDDVPGPGDDVPGPGDATPPAEPPAVDEDIDETGATAPGTTMICGSDALLPHALDTTHRPPEARAVRTLTNGALSGLDMAVGAAMHRPDQQHRRGMGGQRGCHPVADAIRVIETITPPPVFG